ncbi:GFA family protein [Aspergillus puulaauensis]|uniref:CENP-V/GFA domain-containing protein n=1 Tax=Aspergillus puulaauensis TaxID=1220207 RepID=A0A7R7Y233_9EURO|nr:uncharacterized protein APUU_81037S [Aspergillus puulaauensis]BCS30734.1 hypothetical protein APUU_81037S [Aspergillus puulaauensis]
MPDTGAQKPDNAGSCLCEAVKFKLYGKPLQCAVCHCDSCQQFSGSAFMVNCWYNQENVQIVRGDTLATFHEGGTSSGSTMRRSFCRACGSSVFQQTGDLYEAGIVSVASGTMLDRSEAIPSLEVWCRNRRPWLALTHSGETKETQ